MRTASPLIYFYLGEGTDHRQRTIEEVWSLSPFWLEHAHDYIQWLFPIPEAGRFNGFAPTLGEEERMCFVQSTELQTRQRRSLDVMLGFFGLQRNETEIIATPNLTPKEHIWLKRGGHNHLRISRIIRSLHLCGQPELAQSMQQAVIHIGSQQGFVSESSLAYWRSANWE